MKSVEDANEAVEELVRVIDSLSAGGGGISPSERSQLVTSASGSLVKLRGAVRAAYLDEDACRRRVAASTKEADSFHLQLQNLLYERNHLLREIKLCRDLAVSEVEKIRADEGDDELLSGASGLQSESDHQRNLDRLQQELQRRADMQSQLRELELLMKKEGNELEDRKQWLEGLPDCLKELERASEPLKKYAADFDLGEKRELQRRASGLSLPLHTLFCQLEAYCDYKGEERGLEVRVVPSVRYKTDPAKSSSSSSSTATTATSVAMQLFASPLAANFTAKKRRKLPHYSTAAEHEDADPDFASKEEGVAVEVLDINDLLICHGDAVELSIKPAPDVEACIRFQLMLELGIVVVEASSCSFGPQGKPQHLLANLFPRDTGERTPNLSNCHMAGDGDFIFPSDIAGRPYRWAQWLAGISLACPGESPLEPTTAAVVERIRSRVLSASALAEQLSVLSSKTLPSAHPDIAPLLAPASRINVLVFEEVAYDSPPSATASSSPAWEAFGCRAFKLVLAFGQKTWEGHITLYSEYPLRPPKFAASKSESTVVDVELRSIDAEVNGHCSELLTEDVGTWDKILAHQVLRCAGCLVAWDRGGGATTGRARRGRSRRIQVMYSSHEHAFTHR